MALIKASEKAAHVAATPAAPAPVVKPTLTLTPKPVKAAPVKTAKAAAPKAVAKPKAATPAAKPVRKAPAGATKAVKANETAFTLEDGIAVPPRTRAAGASPYPFASMKKDQSFVVKAKDDEEKKRIANRLSGATRRFTKHNPAVKFAVRTVEDGIRVWRVE